MGFEIAHCGYYNKVRLPINTVLNDTPVLLVGVFGNVLDPRIDRLASRFASYDPLAPSGREKASQELIYYQNQLL